MHSISSHLKVCQYCMSRMCQCCKSHQEGDSYQEGELIDVLTVTTIEDDEGDWIESDAVRAGW